MVRLHLVGFTTDLKNLIFADERGATSGGFVVSVDSRLRQTLDEVARLGEAEYGPAEVEETEEPEAPPTPKVVSKLSPKEIQSLLREGKTEEQVARLAGTGVDWIQRFSFAILAERRDVIDAVRSARLSKPRLGPSGMTVGDAVEENLGSKRLRMGPEAIEESWKAMRKNGRWQVSFEYESRGQKRLARYSFDPNTRQVEPLNDIALELGWRADSPRTKTSAARPAAGPPKIVSGVRQAGRSAAGSKPGQQKAAGSARPAGGRGGTERPISAGTRPTPKPIPSTTRRSSIAPKAEEEAAKVEETPGVSRRDLARPEAEEPRAQPGTHSDPEADATSDEFIIQRPRKPERIQYGSLPTVWRPSRRG